MPLGLDAPVGEDGQPRGERIGKDDSSTLFVNNADEIKRAMSSLDDKARLMLRLRFVEGMTQAEIATRAKCSQMHVSRVLRRSIEVMSPEVSGVI